MVGGRGERGAEKRGCWRTRKNERGKESVGKWRKKREVKVRKCREVEREKGHIKQGLGESVMGREGGEAKGGDEGRK